jgi:hypothetical protein
MHNNYRPKFLSSAWFVSRDTFYIKPLGAKAFKLPPVYPTGYNSQLEELTDFLELAIKEFDPF